MSVRLTPRPFRLLCTLLVLFISTTAIGQTTYYVRTTGSDAADGTSWSTAFLTLQKALVTAQSGDQIWVATGTYYPDEGPGQTDNDRSSAFAMKNGISILGGFPASDNPVLGDRDPDSFTTVLSGDIDKNNSTDNGNAYHVIRNPAGLNSSALIDGFIITGGNASAGSAPDNAGGGIYNSSTSPAFVNCRISGNIATNGGGVFNVSSSPVLTGCSLQSNSAVFGGGMYSNDNGSPKLINCILRQNTTTNQGGGLFNQTSANTVAVNTAFQSNTAPSGGAVYNNLASPVLINCSFQANSANNGGAIRSVNSSSVTLVNSVLGGNSGGNTFSTNSSTLTVAYSLFDATVTAGFTSGPGNLTTLTSPFLSASSVALPACSPAINAGDNASYNTLSGHASDLAGKPRFFGNGTIDMGAVELQAVPDQAPTRLYVSATQSATTGDGLSWPTAFTNLQSALACPCSQSLTEIWVATGTYYPDEGPGQTDNDRSSAFAMLNGISILGGFPASDNPVLGDRDPDSFTTVLSGDIDKNNSTDNGNAYHVIRNPAGLNSSALIDGFIITGGNASAGSAPDNAGGGIYNSSTSPAFVNCRISGNIATNGGGVFNVSSSPVLTGCSLQSNSAVFGGGMYSNDNGSPKLINCILRQNTTTNQGGGLFNQTSANTVAVNTAFQSNTAPSGGAVYNNLASPVLINCSFQANSANNGGAIRSVNSSSVTLVNSVLGGNSGGNTFSTNSSTLTVAYSLFDATVTAGFTSGPGNLTTLTSPFLSASSVALPACSPAINAGDNASYNTLSGPASDLAGKPRFFGNGTIDMGAVEFQALPDQPTTVSLTSGSAVCAGSVLSVPVSVSGTGPFTYQWYKGGSVIASQTTIALSIPAISTTSAGSYSVIVTGACNSVTSTVFSLTVNPLPSPTLVASGTLTCALPTVILTAAGGVSYTFSAGATQAGSNTVNVATVQQPDSYSVTAADSKGCISTTAVTVTTDKSLPTISITAASTTLTCSSPTVLLTATSSATNLLWSTAQTTAAISVSQTGPYSVTATGANGCSAVSNDLLIGENKSITGFSVHSVTVCQGQTLSLLTTGCAPGTVQWSNGATGNELTLTAGSSTSLLTATCTIGTCSTTASGTIVVGGLQPPPAQIVTFTADESACPVRLTGQGSGTSFVITGVNGYVFSTIYRTGGTHEAVGLNVTKPGTYTLTATYTNQCGSSQPETRTVTVRKNCP